MKGLSSGMGKAVSQVKSVVAKNMGKFDTGGILGDATKKLDVNVNDVVNKLGGALNVDVSSADSPLNAAVNKGKEMIKEKVAEAAKEIFGSSEN